MNSNKKTIAFITGTRADYGIMQPVLQKIQQSPKLKLQLYATGMHLMSDYGHTIDIVKRDFPEVSTINVVFKTNNRLGMARFTSQLLSKLTEIFAKNRPDLSLVFSDRSEMLCVAITSLYFGIPIVHIHGGDITNTIDDSTRHAISKMSHIHFPPTEEAKNRLINMGEEKWRIHVVGALGLDSSANKNLLARKELFEKFKIATGSKFVLVTQHPVSEEINEAAKQMKETIEAIKKINLPVIVIYPNADAGSRDMIKIINKEKNNPVFHIFPNIDHKIFLSLEKEANVWVGNSSAGIVDSSFYKTPVVNIGIRQLGRPQGENIINVNHDAGEIYKAMKKSLYDKKFLKKISFCHNSWGNGSGTPKIIKILENLIINKRMLIKHA